MASAALEVFAGKLKKRVFSMDFFTHNEWAINSDILTLTGLFHSTYSKEHNAVPHGRSDKWAL